MIHIKPHNTSQLSEVHLLFEVDCSIEDLLHAFTVGLLMRKELVDCNGQINCNNAEISKYMDDGKLNSEILFDFLRIYLSLGSESSVVNRFVEAMVNSKDWHIAVNVLEDRIARVQWDLPPTKL